jgi:hypothetical protein
MWTDASGTFKVEAEFLGLKDGKVLLHKSNNVRIAVPLNKLCNEDSEHIQKLTGKTKGELSNSNESFHAPGSALHRSNSHTSVSSLQNEPSHPAQNVTPTPPPPPPKTFVYNNFNWLLFFTAKNVSKEDAENYASKFVEEKMDESTVEFINKDLLKDMGVKQGDVLRIMRALEPPKVEPPKEPVMGIVIFKCTESNLI